MISLSSSNLRAAPDQPRYGGTFIVGIDAEPETLNLAITNSFQALIAGAPVFNTLMTYDENYIPHPELAQSWQVAPDGLTYTFNLVRNATWHDGYAFTSADVKFTYTQILSKYQARVTGPLSYVSSVDTPDNYTVVFRMKKSYTPLLYLLGMPVGPILPAHLYSGTDVLTNKNNFAPVGTGPYKFVEWKRSEYVKLAKNDKYWKTGQPYFDQIIFKVIPDATARVLALQRGDINYLAYYSVPYSAVGQLTKDPNLVYTFSRVVPSATIVQLFLNLRRPILNNTDVRHALNYAINKTEMIDKVAFGMGTVAVGPIPSTYGPTVFNPNLPTYPYDVGTANGLLDKAGYPRGANGTRFSLELTWQVQDMTLARASELMKSQLALVGVNVKLNPQERAQMIDTVFNRWNYDMCFDHTATGPVVDVGVSRLSVSSNIGHNAFDNGAAYSNPKVDALWDDAAKTVDPAQRTQDLYQVQVILIQDMPALWLWEEKSIALWGKDFTGLHGTNTNYGTYDLHDAYWLKGTMATPQNVQTAGAPFPWLSVGLAAAAAIVIITGVLMLRKRKRAEQEEAKT